MIKRFPRGVNSALLTLFFSLVLVSQTQARSFAREIQNLPIRALWVTRWDYHSRHDISKIVENARWAGFTDLFFQVRGNATTFYPSRFEPRAGELSDTLDGWDPLLNATAQAHLAGLRIHAWLNIFPGWRGLHPPQNPRQLWNAHPDWFLRLTHQKALSLNSHYVWLNPVLPEVQNHLKNVVLEVARVYNVDGIHFDYFRYPGPGDFPSDSSFSNLRRLFPFRNSTEADWDAFRRNQISHFLKMCRDSLQKENPALILSGAILGDILLGRRVFFQDSPRWVAEHWLDWVVPMTYTSDTLQFRHWLGNFSDFPRQAVLPGLMVKSVSDAEKELSLTRDFGFSGFSFFSYGSLFPNHRPNSLAFYFHTTFQNHLPVPPLSLNRNRRKWPYPEKILFPTGNFPLFSRERARVFFAEPVAARARFFSLQWTYPDSGRTWNRSPLEAVRGNPKQLRTTLPLTLTKATENLTLKIAFQPDSGKSAKILRSFHFPVAPKISPYYFSSFWGTPVKGARRILVTRNHVVYIPAGDQIVVLDSTGKETPFSPITAGLDHRGHRMTLRSCYGIVQIPSGEIAVTGFNGGGHIFRFQAETGRPLPAIPLKFFPGDMAADTLGHYFVLEAENSQWHVLDQNGFELSGSPVSGSHRSYGIAVSPDGRSVFVSCRSDGKVHHWVGDVSMGEARYRQLRDLPVRDVGFGTLTLLSPTRLLICEPDLGYISVWNIRQYSLQEVLHSPFLRAPRAVAEIPGTSDLLILETSGQTPVRQVKFSRE
ncbi:MAG: family 10 glycosylhydrolase [Calditrichaeota bacterium]|nr:family 10 glycosylhydrolase [Calditrichota bacterium]